MSVSRVLILSMEYTPDISGGVGTHAYELARGLTQAGLQVTVVACSPGQPRSFDDGGVAVHLVAANQTPLGRCSIVEGILATNTLLVRTAAAAMEAAPPPDVIQSYGWLTFQAAADLGGRFNAPVVSTIQYLSYPVELWWGQEPDPDIVLQEKALFSTGGRFIAASGSIRDLLTSVHSMAGDRISVVHNAMDPSMFSKEIPLDRCAKLRRALAPDGSDVVLFAGRLSPQKGIAALLESAARLVEQRPMTRYVFVGDPDSADFARFIESVPQRYPALSGRTVFLGKAPRNRLPFLYRAADVAVVPSVYEPFGYAAIEAMAAGTPLIASDCGGLSEIVEHERTGLLAPVREQAGGQRQPDVDALVQAQLRLLADRSFACRLAQNARTAVVDRFHAADMARATQDVYVKAVSERPT